MERLLSAPAGSVALRDSNTACQAAIAGALQPSPRRNRIIVSELDFHSALHLWRAQERRGFEVVVVPSRDDCSITEQDILQHLDERVVAVAVALVSRNSALLNAAPVIAAAHEVGAIVILDAYQAVGVVPLDVSSLGADVVVGGTHKWLCGETGLAFMYVARALSERLSPAYPGWFGHADLHAFVHTHEFVDSYVPVAGARRFQQGTPAMEAIYGARAGLRFVLEVGVKAIAERNSALLDYLIRGCERRGFVVRTPAAATAHAGGICLGPSDPERVVQALAAQGIDVDQRRKLLVRLAPHPCVTEDECERVLTALENCMN